MVAFPKSVYLARCCDSKLCFTRCIPVQPHNTAAAFLIPVGVIIYTAIGGLKGTFLSFYGHAVVVFIALCIFTLEVYAGSSYLGSPSKVWNNLNVMADPNVVGSRPVDGNKGMWVCACCDGEMCGPPCCCAICFCRPSCNVPVRVQVCICCCELCLISHDFTFHNPHSW